LKPKEIERIRLLAIKLGNHRHWKTNKVVGEIERRFNVSLSKRTVQLWKKKHREQNWDLIDKSRRPKTIHYKITPIIEQQVIRLRRTSGYDAFKIQNILARMDTNISMSGVKRIIAKYGLSNGSEIKGQRLKYCRWQRQTPNSLWQLDHTEEVDGTIRLPVEDDCSRYCLALEHWSNISTVKVTRLLDGLISRYGKPRQILTDNGSIYQKEFDKWCGKRGIEHIRSGVNKPTTVGKIEKLHDIYNREIGHWKTVERWRYQYNHWRPHRSLDGKTPAEVYNEFHRLLFFNRKWTKSIREKTRNML
jgi:putative transposase